MGGGAAADGRERATAAATAPALRDEFPYGRHARLNRPLLRRRLQLACLQHGRAHRAHPRHRRTLLRDHTALGEEGGRPRLQTDYAPRRLAAKHHDERAGRLPTRSRTRRAQRVSETRTANG